MKIKNISHLLKMDFLKIIALSLFLLNISCTEKETLSDSNLESININRLSGDLSELPVLSIISDEEQSVNSAENAIDTSATSRWSAFGGSVNLILDLGSLNIIDYINIAFYKGDERISSFQVYTSNDNENWTLKNNIVSSGDTENLETFDLTNTYARYIRLKCNGNSLNDWNSILDIEVYGIVVNNNMDSTPNNIAQGKNTSQSTTIYDGESSRAVDGNTNGVWNKRSVTHTSDSAEPWWTVNLANDYNIGDVVIYNRANCCTDRLSDFNVDVLNSNGSVVSTIHVADTPSPSIVVNFEGVKGRSIKVSLNGTNPLSLAEVEVYEYK